MFIELLTLAAAMLATGIETAFVPSDDGGGEYLVRVEPDLVSSRSPYTFTSDIPVDERDVRRVCIYVADRWPAAVERTVIEAAARPKVIPAGPAKVEGEEMTTEAVVTLGRFVDCAFSFTWRQCLPWHSSWGYASTVLVAGPRAYSRRLCGGVARNHLIDTWLSTSLCLGRTKCFLFVD